MYNTDQKELLAEFKTCYLFNSGDVKFELKTYSGEFSDIIYFFLWALMITEFKYFYQVKLKLFIHELLKNNFYPLINITIDVYSTDCSKLVITNICKFNPHNS